MKRRATATRVAITVNGILRTTRVTASTTLLQLVRDRFGLTGTTDARGVGECGACTVLLDGEPTLSRLVLAPEADGRTVTTIAHATNPRLRRLRRAFADHGAIQCGFCTPGMILAASPLPANATAAAIRSGLAGNICRCTGYTKIVRAVQQAGRRHGSTR